MRRNHRARGKCSRRPQYRQCHLIRSPFTRFFTPHFRFRLIEQDPDDNKFVDCAIVAGADYIVSEDTHFRILETIPFPKVNVIRLNRFMEELAGL